VLVPFDFALNRPRRLTPGERVWLEKWADEFVVGTGGTGTA
jgi:acyl-CoA thioester hydrolase